MKYLLLLLLICLLSGCTTEGQSSQRFRCKFDPIASWTGRGVSGKQVVPIKKQTSVNSNNDGGWTF